MSSALNPHVGSFANIASDARYRLLGAPYVVPTPTSALPTPALACFNAPLAESLGIAASEVSNSAFMDVLAGNREWPGYAPISSVYAGHQFGHLVPQLGDGRAHLIAEILDIDGRHRELQLKGSGPTPYSRFADGRAVLRSSIREYLCSETMHGLGIPTTRALSLVHSPQPVRRETIETAAVVCRVAPSFVRFGHFEYFYYQRQPQALAPLADFIIASHFPQFADREDRYAVWLSEMVQLTARLMAQWQAVGFCHGVMNTDNFSILGLTIDYGPFGFLDAFDPDHICNHTDEGGRYAYDRQPAVGHWNCSRLLQACLPLLADAPEQAVEIANAILDRYPPAFTTAAAQHWQDKLGLREPHEGDSELIERLLAILARGASDFTRSFRNLASLRSDSDEPATEIRDEIADLEAFDAWVIDYRSRLRAEQSSDAERAARMNQINPKYVLRNHLAQTAIERAETGDFSEVLRLEALLAKPFNEQSEFESYAAEPPASMRHIEVSCSS